MPYLKENTYSSYTPDHCYGYAGQKVTIYSDHGGTLIVESWPGVRFPVLPNQLTDEPIIKPTTAADVPKEVPVASKKAPAVRRQKRAQSYPGNGAHGGSCQGSLFGDGDRQDR